MIDTIYFDNWNTLVQAPNLMERGSSTRIFKEYLGNQGLEVPDNFIDIYMLIARAQERRAESGELSNAGRRPFAALRQTSGTPY